MDSSQTSSDSPNPADSVDTPPMCEVESLLGRFHDGELDRASTEAVEHHLTTCEDCRLQLDEIRDLSTLARQIGSEGLSQSVVREIHRSVDELQSFSIVRVVGVLTGLAASVLVVGGVWLAEIPGTPRPAGMMVIVSPQSSWEAVALNPNADPIVRETWERRMLADSRMVDRIVQGLGEK